ncbi:MAG: hypothetical protein PHX51_06280 [Clostridia bacterium]|nr:hypothetical protein [Clostridia bacterium]
MVKHKKAVFTILIILTVIAVFIVGIFGYYMNKLSNERIALNTMNKLNDYPLYTMDFSMADYDLDEALDYGIYNGERLMQYISEKYLGFPVSIDLDKFVTGGCVTFSADSQDGEIFFAATMIIGIHRYSW